MFVIKAMFALCYIFVNVMAIVTVFRFEDVSRATLSAFGSSSSSGSSSSLLPVVEALNVQVDNHRTVASSQSQSQLRQHEQQRPDLSLSMRTVAEGGLFPVSQGTDIFNNNNNDVAAPTSSVSSIDEQTLVEDLQQQHEQMQKMMQLMQPKEQQEQQETHVIMPSVITTKAIGKTKTSVSSSTVRSTRRRSSGRMSTLLKGIRLSSADNDRHPMLQQPTKKTLNTGTSIIKAGMPLPRLSSAMANGDRKLGPISYKMIVQDLRTQDIQKQNERDERMTILGIYLASVSSPFHDDDDNEHEQHISSLNPVSPCWKQKHHLVVSI